MFPLEDTICAIASARSLRGLRGVVRLSGPASFSALEALGIVPPDFLDENHSTPDSAWVSRSSFHFEAVVPIQGPSLPGPRLPARVYCWRNGHSYTGQEAAEIHAPGVLPFLEVLLASLCRTGLVRMAQPGEFTLRAFLSGRMDLTQAEAVLGTIDAQDPKKLKAALHQLAGGLAIPLQGLRDRLFELLGHLEAGFDFADEDIEFISASEIAEQLEKSCSEIEQLLQKMRSRSSSGPLPRVVLYGAPNIGKSALFNALTGTGSALVFDRPGTTRDYLCAELSLGAFACQLVDTAGDFQEVSGVSVREPLSDLNEKSQELAREQKALADVPLFCFDAEEFAQARPEAFPILEAKTAGEGLLLLTRCDRVPETVLKTFLLKVPVVLSRRILAVSSVEGTGISWLRTRLERILSERSGDESDVVASTQTRCRESLQLAFESLDRARLLCGTEFQELIATEVRTALDQIGLMVGAVYSEDLLDSIFSRFCVGK